MPKAKKLPAAESAPGLGSALDAEMVAELRRNTELLKKFVGTPGLEMIQHDITHGVKALLTADRGYMRRSLFNLRGNQYVDHAALAREEIEQRHSGEYRDEDWPENSQNNDLCREGGDKEHAKG